MARREVSKLTDMNLLIHNQVRKMRNKFRKLVCGDENKRIRDFVDENKEVPSVVKLFDKLLFTFGVFNIAIFQYFMLNAPQKYWLYHTFTLSFLLSIRLYYWKKQKWHYFLLDFCYFTNLWLVICCLFRLDHIQTFFNACFICSVGNNSFNLFFSVPHF